MRGLTTGVTSTSVSSLLGLSQKLSNTGGDLGLITSELGLSSGGSSLLGELSEIIGTGVDDDGTLAESRQSGSLPSLIHHAG